MKTVIVCVIGTVRGGPDAWNSLIKHVLKPLGADLALFTAKTKKTILHEVSKFDWSFEDPDWTAEMSRVCSECGLEEDAWHVTATRTSYEGMFGGVMLQGQLLKGKGAIIMIIRDLLLCKLPILKKYDKIIITRSDHMYFFDHPQFTDANIEIPLGNDDWWGYSERHNVIDNSIIETYLCILKWWMQNLDFVETSIKKHHNPEQLLALYVKTLSFSVHRPPRCMTSVSLKEDFTRWKLATVVVPGYSDLFLKYPHEYFTHIKSKPTRFFVRRVKYTNNFQNVHQ